jgi:hypothetical protein
MCTVLLLLGVYPIAVKYISYIINKTLFCKQRENCWRCMCCASRLSSWHIHSSALTGIKQTVEISIVPRIPNVGTRLGWVVSSMTQSFYPQYPLNRKLGGPQSWTGCFGDEKNLFSVLESDHDHSDIQSIALSHYWLTYPNFLLQ